MNEPKVINNSVPSTPEPTTQTVHGQMPEHLAGVKMEDTFLPETAPETPETPATPAAPATETPATPTVPATPATPTKEEVTPAAPATPAAPIAQPATAANAEIVDKTQPPVIYAGKYKTVDDLKKGIEELGGDPSGIEDPKALEQGYYAAQKIYNRMTARNKKADEIATPKEEPKKWALDDATLDGMMNEVDFTKVENAGDLLRQSFQIMFKHLSEKLPQMYPQKPGEPQMSPQEMAATIEQVQTNTDSLAFLEAKVPRLTTDQNFRSQFANHLAAGKKAGTYGKKMTRDDMIKSMKDFLAGAQAIAAEAAKLDTSKEDKGAAAIPDNAGTPASTEPSADPDSDVLSSIMGAKVEQDTKFAFPK